jgi:hypothetical protein
MRVCLFVTALVGVAASVKAVEEQPTLRGTVATGLGNETVAVEVENKEQDKQWWWGNGGDYQQAPAPAPRANGPEDGLQGKAFLDQLRVIISNDPYITPQQVQWKPFMGSFSTMQDESDPRLANVKYCITDTSCGHVEAYSRTDVPLSALAPCNK